MGSQESDVDIWSEFYIRRKIEMIEMYLSDNIGDFKEMSELSYMYYCLHFVTRDKKDLLKAMELCDECIYHDRTWESVYIKGLIMTRVPDREKAVECMNEVIEVNPYFFEPYLVIGRYYLHSGKPEIAIELFNIARGLNPSSKRVAEYRKRALDEIMKKYNCFTYLRYKIIRVFFTNEPRYRYPQKG